MTAIDLDAIAAERDRIRADYLADVATRPASSARGLHHFALICSDVRRTIDFYQGLLEFPLTEIFENRDYAGSNHFFFDIGEGNLLAFFDLPGLDLARTPKSSADCTTSRSPSPRRSGITCAASSTPPASNTWSSPRSRSTSATRTALGLSCWPTRWARCMAPRSSERSSEPHGSKRSIADHWGFCRPPLASSSRLA